MHPSIHPSIHSFIHLFIHSFIIWFAHSSIHPCIHFTISYIFLFLYQDLPDAYDLLHPKNVNHEKLLTYAREAANFSTKFQLPHMDFAINHQGKEDVAMFDFTSLFAAEYSIKIYERKGQRLLGLIVGDSLLEVWQEKKISLQLFLLKSGSQS